MHILVQVKKRLPTEKTSELKEMKNIIMLFQPLIPGVGAVCQIRRKLLCWLLKSATTCPFHLWLR
jgi:hypothetical protein